MDQQLASRLSDFNRLVLDYQDEAYTLAWYLIGNEAQVEAVMQEAVELAFHCFLSGHAACHLLILRQVVKQCRGQEPADYDSNEPGMFPNLRFLPEPERIVLVLIDILGLSYTDTSRIIGASIKETGRLLTQARRRLIKPIFTIERDGR